MMEVIRRIVLLGSLTVGLWMSFYATPFLFRVSPTDWNHERRRIEKNSSAMEAFAQKTLGTQQETGIDFHPETRLDREGFIAHQTQGRRVTVSGAEWEGLFSGVAATVLGDAPSAAWRARKAVSLYDESLFFGPGEAPFTEIAGEFDNPDDALRYVEIRGKRRSEYLLVQRSDRDDIFSHAPSHLVFPNRTAGIALILVGFIFYVFLPWPRRPAEGLYYARPRAIVGPDVMGCVIGGLFFVIPILVPQANSGDSPFSPGWSILTAVLWLVAGIIFTTNIVAAWYTVKQLDMAGDSIAYTALNDRFTRRLDEVAGVEPVDRPMIPKWLRWMLFGLALLNWRALGPALMLGGRETGIRILFRDGKSVSFLLKGLVGGIPLVGRLRARGVPVADKVYAALGLKPKDPAFDAVFPPPPPSLSVGFLVFSVFVALLIVVPLGLSLPPAAPKATTTTLPEKAFALPAESDPGITWETIRKENEIIAQVRKLGEKLNEIEARMKRAAPEERKALTAESEAVMAKMEELQKQFDEARTPAATPPAEETPAKETP